MSHNNFTIPKDQQGATVLSPRHHRDTKKRLTAIKIEGGSDGRQDGETTRVHVIPEMSEHRHRKRWSGRIILPLWCLQQRRSTLLVRPTSIGTGTPCRRYWTVRSRQGRPVVLFRHW